MRSGKKRLGDFPVPILKQANHTKRIDPLVSNMLVNIIELEQPAKKRNGQMAEVMIKRGTTVMRVSG